MNDNGRSSIPTDFDLTNPIASTTCKKDTHSNEKHTGVMMPSKNGRAGRLIFGVEPEKCSGNSLPVKYYFE